MKIERNRETIIRPAHHKEKNVRMDSVLFFVVLISVVFLMSNLAAIIDFFLHPEIPYFAQDHVIVGGIYGLLSGLLFCLSALCPNNARQTVLKNGTLKAILPICASCKKVRVSDSNMYKIESWQELDCYIAEQTATQFSHGCCPDCRKTLYPGLIAEVEKHHIQPIQTSPELGYT